MYTKCVYIVPVSGVSADVPLKQKNFETEKKVTGVLRETVYTKCVYIVLVSGVDAELPWKLKKSYWCWKRNVVYKMCIHRSCLWSTCRFTFEKEKKVTSVERGTVYTKCV